MKRFKKRSDLIKHAVRMTYRRKADKAKEDKKAFLANLKKNNFLQWAAGVAQGIIK
jgi:Arc/MetJ-type ribon-helix-helix transcriptional regulator